MKQSKSAPLATPKTARSPAIFIFVALVCEAKPLLQLLRLKQDRGNHPFLIYRADGIVLTVSGVGKVAMAGAVSYAMACFGRGLTAALLNVGIAGHQSHPTGTLCQAIKIIDATDGKAYYPAIMSEYMPNSGVLKTVAMPVKHYLADFLYDMEGAAFYAMAARFSSAELISCSKIVSDNAQSAATNINAKQVARWIDQQLPVLAPLIKALAQLATTYAPVEPNGYQQIIEQWHFTVSEQLQLKALLLRWQVLTNGAPLALAKQETKNAKQLLQKLTAELDGLAFYL